MWLKFEFGLVNTKNLLAITIDDGSTGAYYAIRLVLTRGEDQLAYFTDKSTRDKAYRGIQYALSKRFWWWEVRAEWQQK